MNPVFQDIASADQCRITFPAGGDVHVWLIGVRTGERNCLNEEETGRAGRFRFAADADLFATGRLALRRLAGNYLGIAASEVNISGDGIQKPELSNSMSRPLHFNLSHSGRLVLIAFSEKPLGIDIEQMNPGFDPQNLMTDHFDNRERAVIDAASDLPAAFYQLWTRKEALLKARGTGLQDDMRLVPVLGEMSAADPTGDRWRLLSFRTIPGYAAALACNVSAGRIVFYRDGHS